MCKGNCEEGCSHSHSTEVTTDSETPKEYVPAPARVPCCHFCGGRREKVKVCSNGHALCNPRCGASRLLPNPEDSCLLCQLEACCCNTCSKDKPCVFTGGEHLCNAVKKRARLWSRKMKASTSSVPVLPAIKPAPHSSGAITKFPPGISPLSTPDAAAGQYLLSLADAILKERAQEQQQLSKASATPTPTHKAGGLSLTVPLAQSGKLATEEESSSPQNTMGSCINPVASSAMMPPPTSSNVNPSKGMFLHPNFLPAMSMYGFPMGMPLLYGQQWPNMGMMMPNVASAMAIAAAGAKASAGSPNSHGMPSFQVESQAPSAVNVKQEAAPSKSVTCSE